MALMQERDHNQLWLGLSHDKFDQFWSVNRKLMEYTSEEGFRHIPFRLYALDLGSSRPFLQFLIKPVENEKKTTVEDLLKQANLKSKGSVFLMLHFPFRNLVHSSFDEIQFVLFFRSIPGHYSWDCYSNRNTSAVVE